MRDSGRSSYSVCAMLAGPRRSASARTSIVHSAVPIRICSTSPACTSFAGLMRTPFRWTWPPSTAAVASARVLKKRAAHSHLSTPIEAANRMLPLFAHHSLWRPKAREFIGALMRETDIRMLKEDLEQGVRLAKSLGVDVSGIELPAELH